MPKYTATYEFEADDDQRAVEYARAAEYRSILRTTVPPRPPLPLALVKLTTEQSYTYDRRVDLDAEPAVPGVTP